MPAQRAGRRPPRTQVRFGILGPLTVWRDAEPTTPRSAVQRALLGVLLLAEGRPVTPERLLDLVWHDDPPGSGRACVQVAICRLREWLEQNAGTSAVLKYGGSGYSLLIPPGALDLDQFRAAMDVGTSKAGLTRVTALESALRLWRGGALEGSGLNVTLTGGLDALRRNAACALAHAAIETGEPQRAYEHLVMLVGDAPYDEGLHAAYALVLSGCGRQAEALHAIDRCRTLLAEELGIDPGWQLRDAHAQVLRQGSPAPRTGGLPGHHHVVVDVSEILGMAGLAAGTARLMLVLDAGSHAGLPDYLVSAVRARTAGSVAGAREAVLDRGA